MFIALVAAEQALDRGSPSEAVRLLREAEGLDAEGRRFRDALVFTLEVAGGAPDPTCLPPVLTLAVRVAEAAALAAEDQRQCVDLLAQALPAADVTAAARIADLERVLPVLCTGRRSAANSAASPLALLVQDLATTVQGPVSELTLARCATVLGDVETADLLWASALRSAPVEFSLGWAVRYPRENLTKVLGRADKNLLAVRVMARSGGDQRRGEAS